MNIRKENLLHMIKADGSCLVIRCSPDCPFFRCISKDEIKPVGCTRVSTAHSSRREQCIKLFLSEYGTKEELVEALI